MKTSKVQTRSTGLLVAGIFFILSAVFALTFIALYDTYNMVLYIVAVLSIISTLGAILRKKFAVYVVAVSIPLIIVICAATLVSVINTVGFYPNIEVLAFNLLLILFSILWLIFGLFVIDKRELLTK